MDDSWHAGLLLVSNSTLWILLKLWNSRVFQQITWSSADLLCSSLLSSINEKIKNISLFSFDGKGSEYFFFYSYERSVWHNVGKYWHSNKYSSEPRQLYKFHWVPLPIYWKQFFDITYHFNDVVKTLKTEIFATSCSKDVISLGSHIPNNVIIHHLTFFPLFPLE